MRSSAAALFGIAFGAAVSQQVWASAEDYLDAGLMFGDFNAGNPGPEVVVPRFTFVDQDADGYPNLVRVWFDTYAAGTNTKLYTSAIKSFGTPPLPAGCDPAAAFDNISLFPQVRRSGTSPRITMFLGLNMSCFDGVDDIEQENTAVYSASVAAAGGGAWRYIAAKRYLWGFGEVDTDGDALNDAISVMLGVDVATGANGTVVVLDKATGTVLSSTVYPVVRIQ